MADSKVEVRGLAACNDRCGCPSPCPGGTTCSNETVAEPARRTTSGARAGSIADAIHAHAARLKPPGAAGPERCTANVVPVVPALLVPIDF
ncbi:hypothetical protein CXB51_000228 [Gossypium anomalum]|uniref:Metallothionein-like protein n=1 Tax=Gossypium anomalum TaxID=47600 RepID=A0A8J5ZI75_9ROSI|nr:hypothetical protein CXB51_000228 [Gossypium anomalum]